MTTGAALRVAAIVVALLATTLLTHYVRGGKAIYFFEPHHIVWLFGASNTAFLVAMLLQLYRVARDGAAGVSLHANALNLAAVAVRGVFVGGGHFGSSAFALTEAALSLGAALALFCCTRRRRRASRCRPSSRARRARPRTSRPRRSRRAASAGASSRRCSRRTSTTFSLDLPGGVDLPRGGRGAAAARAAAADEAAAPRSPRTRSSCGRSRARSASPLGDPAARRRAPLVADDFVHVALLADFVALCVQSLAAGGSPARGWRWAGSTFEI